MSIRRRPPRTFHAARQGAHRSAAPDPLFAQGERQLGDSAAHPLVSGRAEVVSGGELFARCTGDLLPRTSSSVAWGKSFRELGEAVDAGVRLVNVESEAELRVLDGIACERKRNSCRSPPQSEITVDSPHAYIKTGGKGHKFGIPYDEGLSAARLAASLPWIELAGSTSRGFAARRPPTPPSVDWSA